MKASKTATPPVQQAETSSQVAERLNRLMQATKDPAIINGEIQKLQARLSSLQKSRISLDQMVGKGTPNTATNEKQIKDIDADIFLLSNLLEKMQKTTTRYPKKASVLYDFEAGDESQLSIYVGDVVEILEGGDEYWAYVGKGNEEGYVPHEYIQIIQPPPRPPLTRPIPPIVEEPTIIQPPVLPPKREVESIITQPPILPPKREVESTFVQPPALPKKEAVVSPPPPPIIEQGTEDRGALLSQITGFKGGLKRTVTNDRSAPIVKDSKPAPTGSVSKSGGNMMADILAKRSQMGARKDVPPSNSNTNPSPKPPLPNKESVVAAPPKNQPNKETALPSKPLPRVAKVAASPSPSPAPSTHLEQTPVKPAPVKAKTTTPPPPPPPIQSNSKENVSEVTILKEEIRNMKAEFHQEIQNLKNEIETLKQHLGW